MSEYTKRPWEVVMRSMGGLFVRSEPTVIAEVLTHTPESNANAHLIAAAPELLEAAEELLAWAKSVEGCEVSQGITDWGEIFKYARAAIQKAKGEI